MNGAGDFTPANDPANSQSQSPISANEEKTAIVNATMRNINSSEREKNNSESVNEAGNFMSGKEPADSQYMTVDEIMEKMKSGELSYDDLCTINADGSRTFNPPVRTLDEVMLLLSEIKITGNKKHEQEAENEINTLYPEITDETAKSYIEDGVMMPHILSMILQRLKHLPITERPFTGLRYTENDRAAIAYEICELLKLMPHEIKNPEAQREYKIWKLAVKKYGTIKQAVDTYLDAREARNLGNNDTPPSSEQLNLEL